jgi:hypothetical protein
MVRLPLRPFEESTGRPDVFADKMVVRNRHRLRAIHRM